MSLRDLSDTLGRELRRERLLVLLAGSNGAGKSTLYDHALRDTGLPFVNADLIADALPGPPSLARDLDAARRADAERAELVAAGHSFITETVFSDPKGAKLEMLRDAQRHGYAVWLVFVGLASPELSVLRVSQRVASGGHSVPVDRLFARYERTLRNAREAVRFVDRAWLFDNSSDLEPYRLVATFERGRCVARGTIAVPRWARAIAPALGRRGAR